MAGFLTELELKYLDGKKWEILAPFEYCVGAPNGWPIVTIPRGFITDFASIPRMFWSILPPTGKYGKAAVVHDWLYRYPRLQFIKDGSLVLVSKELCDAIFDEAMEVLGVGSVTRSILYCGVHLGGGSTWRKYRKLEEV
jgi:hypothetical protein